MKQLFTNKLLFRLVLINLFFGMTEALMSLRSTFLAENGMKPSQVGIIFAITNIIGTLSPLIGGALADKFFTRYQVFIVSLFGFSFVMAFMPLSAEIQIGAGILSMILMPMIQIFHPVGSIMIATCSINAVYRTQGVDYSMIRLWMSIGYTTANLMFSPVIRALGINAPFYIAQVFFLAIFILRKTIKDAETVEVVSENVETIDRSKLSFKDIYKNYYIVTFIFINIIYCAANNCAAYLSYFLEEYSIDKSQVTLVAGIKVLGEVIIMLIIPRLKRYISLSGLQLIAGTFLCLELTMMQFVQSLLPLVFVVMLGGIGNGIAFCTAGLYVREMSPKGLEATAISLWSMSSSLGGIILSYGFGLIIDRFGILTNYRFGLILQMLWVVLFFLSLVFGKFVLKKKNVVPMIRADKI